MPYSDELNFLYNNRDTSQCTAEEIDEILQKMNEFCGKWCEKATASQVWDFMRLFHNDAPTAQNEFIYYLIDDVVERLPATAIPEIINHLSDLEQTKGNECTFYLIISICRKGEYVKYCLDTLNDISTSKRDIILSELRKNGGNNALAIINSVQESP